MNNHWLELKGKVVIVTGGASGIGKHVANTLMAAEASTVIVDLNVATGDTLDGAYCVQCNVCDPDSVKTMVQTVLDRFGHVIEIGRAHV